MGSAEVGAVGAQSNGGDVVFELERPARLLLSLPLWLGMWSVQPLLLLFLVLGTTPRP
jgi:hypothetical protein